MVIVFPNIEALSNVLPLPSGVEIGVPAQSQDGRVAIEHAFCEEDLAVFGTIEGVVMVEKIPDDWQYPMME